MVRTATAKLFSVEVDAPNEDIAKKYTHAALRRDRPDVAATEAGGDQEMRAASLF